MSSEENAFKDIKDEKILENMKAVAEIEQRKSNFNRAPLRFTLYRTLCNILRVTLWLGTVALMTQCSCDCIWKAPAIEFKGDTI